MSQFEAEVKKLAEVQYSVESKLMVLPQIAVEISNNRIEIDRVAKSKADLVVNDLIRNLQKQIRRFETRDEKFKCTISDLQNYVDKYLPIQVHREITKNLQFTLQPNADFVKRLLWYDEIKTPLLTSLILCDTGQEALSDRIQLLHKISLDKVMSLNECMTEEEQFMAKAM